MPPPPHSLAHFAHISGSNHSSLTLAAGKIDEMTVGTQSPPSHCVVRAMSDLPYSEIRSVHLTSTYFAADPRWHTDVLAVCMRESLVPVVAEWPCLICFMP